MRTNYVHITQQIDDSIQISHRSHIYLMGLQLYIASITLSYRR